ncbi:MAG: helix-turn-helix transcriptional regulator [Candidatus Contendobacter sp.]
MSDELDLIRGGGNVYRDLGWPDAEARRMRAELAAEIIRELRERRLSQRKAAEITGLAQPDISRIKNADLKGFTIDRLVTVLNRLNQHVEIRVTPAARVAIPPVLRAESGSTPSPFTDRLTG